MKRFGMFCTVCAAAMLFSGCGAKEEQVDPMQAEMQVTIPDDFDTAYSDCLKTYFEAIENKDYAAYQSVIYPPYLDVYAEFLKTQEQTPEAAFETMCKRFDEDGYESWHLTELVLNDAQSGEEGIDSFFNAFTSGGVFDEAFTEQCKKDANEIKDIKFSLYALYTGDTDAVPVASDKEILMMKTDAGVYLFG